MHKIRTKCKACQKDNNNTVSAWIRFAMLLQMDAHDLANVVSYSPETKGKKKSGMMHPHPPKKEAIKGTLRQ